MLQGGGLFGSGLLAAAPKHRQPPDGKLLTKPFPPSANGHPPVATA